MNTSIWTKDTSLPQFSSLQGEQKTDVLIIGGGLTGLLCAYLLRKAGVDCLLIEADRICSGVSGNTTAKITSQHGLLYKKLLRQLGAEQARKYYDIQEKAIRCYRSLAGTIDCDFAVKRNYIYSLDDLGKLETELEALERLHIPATLAQDLPLPFDTVGAVCFRNQAQFHPMKFAAGIAAGLQIHEHTRVLEFLGNTVKTESGKIRAEKIIVATHFPMLNKHGAYFLKLYQQRAYVLALEQGPRLDGMYLDAGAGGLSLRNHGSTLLLGSGGCRTGKKNPGWTGLEAIAAAHFPDARPIARWATQDCMSLDGRAYIGPYGKDLPGVYVATGFNKWGMTNAMVSAMILCDLVQEKPNPYAQLFSPQRSMFHVQLLKNGLESMLHLLTPTLPRCPHMGCALKWNRQEHSWDCPCHGSRFAEDGKLLNNPANADKKRSRS